MSTRVIQDILDAKLATVANIPQIIGENLATERTQDTQNSIYQTPYCRTKLLPAQTDTFSLGASGHDRWYGLYQITLFFPANDGTDGPNYAADQIINAFDPSVFLTDTGSPASDIVVRVAQTPWREIAFENTQWFQLPVTVQYEAYIQR